MRKKTFVLGLFTAASSMVFAQSSQINFDHVKDFKQAKYLYFIETYKASQNKFEKVLNKSDVSPNTREAAEFYSALVNLINNEQGAEKRFLAFEKKYPRSIYMQNAHWELGSFYLSQGEYAKAYDYLTQEDLNSLPEGKRNEYQFKLGYAAFMTGKKEEALMYFEPLIQSEQFQDEASYYTGHIYYEQKDFEKAFNYFNELKNRNPEYEHRVLPYVVQIAFNNQQYDKVIEDGTQLLQSSQDPFIQSELSKIVGESYFQLRKYDEAIPYLEAYKGEKSNADYYQLGYAYYQKGDFDTSISLLNKIIVDDDTPLAQTAYYQLGNAYLQTEQKQQALTAYKSASEMEYNQEIKEDAFYNYAKLSYEIGNPFVGTPQVLQNFETNFPNSRYKSEINSYLIDAYISSGNYKSALDMLANIPSKTNVQSNAEQEAAFLYAVNLVKDGDISQATQYFDLATKSGNNSTIRNRSLFWLGESYYRQSKYQEALKYYNQFNPSDANAPERVEIDYQLGYTYLKLRQYPKAIHSFESYLATNPPGAFKADAKLRLADAYIGNQQTNKALSIYSDLATQEPSVSDEAAYNRAITLGILGKNDQKIEALEQFVRDYPTSASYHMAKYELAQAYTQKGNTDKAFKNLDALIKNANSELAARARLQKGLIYNNQNQPNKALAEFKGVAENYPNTQLAMEAVDNAKRIYLESNQLNEFEAWANTLDYYQIDVSELELLAYSSANDLFDKKQYPEAIKAYQTFIQKYPNSGYAAAAEYRLGESYYQTADYAQAEKLLSNAALANNNEYKEDALLRLSQLYLNSNQETEALLILENLNQITSNASYKTFTEVHLMRLYSKRGLHNKAVEMANKVASNPKNESTVIQEAELTNARSLFAAKKMNKAKQAFEKLEHSGSNAIKAEALYYKAFFLNQDKNYKASNDTVFQLASAYAEQQYWGSKALVIMAHNYYKLGDLYQANTTLNAVIDNYQEYPEVVKEAQKLKSEIVSK